MDSFLNNIHLPKANGEEIMALDSPISIAKFYEALQRMKKPVYQFTPKTRQGPHTIIQLPSNSTFFTQIIKLPARQPKDWKKLLPAK